MRQYRVTGTDPRSWRENVLAHVADSPTSFFLESGLVDPAGGRYSYAGTELYRAVLSRGEEILLLDGQRTERRSGNPFSALREFLRGIDPSPHDDIFPFTGGAVGYLGYELNGYIEDVPRAGIDEVMMPDMFMGCFARLWMFDHLENRAYEVVLDGCEMVPGSPALPPYEGSASSPDTLESNFTREEYVRAVETSKEYIAAGDIFQVNLSQRFRTRLRLDPLDLFLVLQRANPAPYSAFLRLGDAAIVSSSPELFLSVRDRKITTRPIKGTRRRGRDEEEDLKLAEELLKSAKDRAELAMIVDLERNDIGRVCRYGTVTVTEPRALESYASVHHLVATVEGEFREDRDVTDLLMATFPGGSITGAPKIRSMEIIAELAPTTRGVYTGAIGYIGANGCVDLNIAIRTIVTRGEDAFFNVGGGIVADSDPDSEYEETLHKGQKLSEVLQGQDAVRESR